MCVCEHTAEWLPGLDTKQALSLSPSPSTHELHDRCKHIHPLGLFPPLTDEDSVGRVTRHHAGNPRAWCWFIGHAPLILIVLFCFKGWQCISL